MTPTKDHVYAPREFMKDLIEYYEYGRPADYRDTWVHLDVSLSWNSDNLLAISQHRMFIEEVLELVDISLEYAGDAGMGEDDQYKFNSLIKTKTNLLQLLVECDNYRYAFKQNAKNKYNRKYKKLG